MLFTMLHLYLSDTHKNSSATTTHNNNRTNNNGKQSSFSSLVKSCVYHPDSTKHSTAECSKNPKNMKSHTSNTL